AIGKIQDYFRNNVFNLARNIIESNEYIFKSLENDISQYINFYYKSLYKKVMIWSKKVKDQNVRNDILYQNRLIFEELNRYYSLFPNLYLHKEYLLLDNYTCNKEFFENDVINDDALRLFCQAADITMHELKTACLSEDMGEALDAEDRIKRKIKTKIQDEFNKFYKQEHVKIKLKIDKTRVAILIDTSGNSMSFSERSGGLRWYLMLFVSLKANELLNEKVVMLIDEPGVQLHVNAQKKLLELFESLTENNKQLIYTTHSPYMLDGMSIVKSRGIDKKHNGMSTFINKIYSGEEDTETRLETLTPLLKVIGLDLKHNIGPSNTKLNLITEGITDFLYIESMLYQMNIKDIYVIPSTGVTNIRNIASILIGWGLHFKIILDNDTEGRKEGDLLHTQLLLNENENFYYLKSISEDKDELEIERMISETDYNELGYKKGKKFNKILAAKHFNEKVHNDDFVVSEETIENFKELFIRMGI